MTTSPGEVSVQRETVVIIDFGAQYSQLIARRVRELEVYCELIPYNAPLEKIASLNPVGSMHPMRLIYRTIF